MWRGDPLTATWGRFQSVSRTWKFHLPSSPHPADQRSLFHPTPNTPWPEALQFRESFSWWEYVLADFLSDVPSSPWKSGFLAAEWARWSDLNFWRRCGGGGSSWKAAWVAGESTGQLFVFKIKPFSVSLRHSANTCYVKDGFKLFYRCLFIWLQVS